MTEPAAMERLPQMRGCPPPMLIADGGHFVQEHGARQVTSTRCLLRVGRGS